MTHPFKPRDIVCLVENPHLGTAKVLTPELWKEKMGPVVSLDRPLDGFRYWVASDLKHALPLSDGETK